MANEPMPEGLTNKDLECVMLDVDELNVREAYGDDLNEDDFYYGDLEGPLKYAQGPVGETEAHVTLLFGIHPSDTYEVDVITTLENWSIPDNVLLSSVDFFPSTVEGEDYVCIIAHVVPTADLVAANRNLRELPHTNAFDDYKPHVTLAYIKGTADRHEWIRRLTDSFAGKFVQALGLNLGNEDD